MNKVFLLGHLGRDMELRFTGGGVPVGTFSIATSEAWTDKGTGQKREKTEWHRIVLWGEMSEKLSQYLVKGKQVLVEGSLQTREWTDKQGQKRYTTEIKSQRVTLLGGGGAKEEKEPKAATEHDPDEGGGGSGSALNDEDIPF